MLTINTNTCSPISPICLVTNCLLLTSPLGVKKRLNSKSQFLATSSDLKLGTWTLKPRKSNITCSECWSLLSYDRSSEELLRVHLHRRRHCRECSGGSQYHVWTILNKMGWIWFWNFFLLVFVCIRIQLSSGGRVWMIKVSGLKIWLVKSIA